MTINRTEQKTWLRLKLRSQIIAAKKWRQDSNRRLNFRYKVLSGRMARPSRVGFIIAGAQKCGTTALDSYLRDHPDVCMAEKKELHFFDVSRHFRLQPDYTLYHSFFDWNTKSRIYGEATPNYMYSQDAPSRIRSYNPEVKLIIVLRDPSERAFSHWNMERDRGVEKRDFMEAIAGELAAKDQRERPTDTSYLRRGLYHAQLNRLWNHIPRKQTLILRYEDLRAMTRETLLSVTEFIGISPFPDIHSRTVHARKYTRRLEREERGQLQHFFRKDVKKLESELGWDCTDWLNKD